MPWPPCRATAAIPLGVAATIMGLRNFSAVIKSDTSSNQLLISPDSVFDASLVPGTCLHRFVDLKGFIQQVPGEF
jgi:uncharacterized membrane protein